MSKTSPTILATKDDAFEKDPLSEVENELELDRIVDLFDIIIPSPVSGIKSPIKKKNSPDKKEAPLSKGSPPPKNQNEIEIKTNERKLSPSASKKQLASTDPKSTVKSIENVDHESIGMIYFDRAKAFENEGDTLTNSQAKFLKYMDATKNYLIAYQSYKMIIQTDKGPKLYRDTFEQIRQNFLVNKSIKTLPFVQVTFRRVGSLLAQKLHEQGTEYVLHKRQTIKSLHADLQEKESKSLAVEEKIVREFKEYSERQWTTAEKIISRYNLSTYLQQAIDKDNCVLSKETKDTNIIINFLNNCIDILKSNSNLR